MLAQNAIYRLLNVVVVFLITLVASRLLGVEGYGILSLMIVNAAIFNLFTSLGSDAGIAYHTAARTFSRRMILKVIWVIIVAQLLVLTMIEIIYARVFGHSWLLGSITSQHLLAAGIFLLSISLTEKYTSLLNGNQLFTRTSKVLLFTNCMTLLAFVAVTFLYPGLSVMTCIWMYILLSLGQSIAFIFAWHLSPASRSTVAHSAVNVRVFFSYSLIALVTNSIQFLAYRIDYWVLDYYRGGRELGWYALAVKLAQFFWILPLVIAAMLLPQVAASANTDQRARVLFLIRLVNVINITGAVIFLFLGHWLVPILFGKAYEPSVNLIWILLPGIVLFGAATIFAAYFAGINRLKVNLAASALCLSVIGCLDLLLIPSLGMQGAAIASSIGYSATAIYYIIRFRMEQEFSLARLFLPGRNDWQQLLQLLPVAFSKKKT